VVLASVMEEVLSLLIINIAARRRPPFGMFPLLGKRQKRGLPASVGFKKYEAWNTAPDSTQANPLEGDWVRDGSLLMQ